jgi:hypothetical protein
MLARISGFLTPYPVQASALSPNDDMVEDSRGIEPGAAGHTAMVPRSGGRVKKFLIYLRIWTNEWTTAKNVSYSRV